MTAPSLPRSWLPVLLALFETGSRTINGQMLFQRYPQWAQGLIAHHWLKTVDRMSTIRHHNQLLTVDWSEQQQRYQMFDPTAGWMSIPADYLNVYRVNFHTCEYWLRHLFHIHPTSASVRIHHNILIDLGVTMIGDQGLTIFLCSQLNDHRICYAVQCLLQKQAHRGPSLLVTGKQKSREPIELPLNFSQTQFTSLLCQHHDHCMVDRNHLAFWLTHQQQKEIPRRNITFSDDYRVVHWKNRSYRLTKKQGDIFEGLWKAGGCAHKDHLQAFANTRSELRWIMRHRRHGQWVVNPLWGTLLINIGNGYYQLDDSADPP